jgi:hypothetical protein
MASLLKPPMQKFGSKLPSRHWFLVDEFCRLTWTHMGKTKDRVDMLAREVFHVNILHVVLRE